MCPSLCQVALMQMVTPICWWEKLGRKEILQLAQCQVEHYKVSTVASDSKVTFSAEETLFMN